MKVSITEESPTRSLVSVSISGEEIANEERSLIKDFSQKAKIPGFRPGKAPESIIRGRFKKPLHDELSQKMVSSAYRLGIADNKELKVFSLVNITGGDDLQPAKDTEIVFHVDVIPPFQTPDFRSFKLDEETIAVTEDEVQEDFAQLLRSRADYQVVEREACKGDFVRLSYEGIYEGNPVAESIERAIYGSQKNTWEEAGTGDKGLGIPSVVDGIVGMKAGDTKVIQHTFTEEVDEPFLRNKTVDYNVEIVEVREVVDPELNEAFFTSFQVKDEAELKEKIRENLMRRKEADASMKQRDAVLQQMRETVEFPLPEEALKHRTQELLGQMMESNIRQGISEDQLREHQQALFEASEARAKDSLKTDIILQQIAEEEKVELTNEDLTNAVMSEAYRNQMKPEDWVNRLKEDERRMARFRQNVLLGKTLDQVIKMIRSSKG